MTTTILVNKTHSEPVGMGELPMNGRRYAVFTETIRHDDGTATVNEWVEEVPESSQPYFWIPSFGCVSQDEMRYMSEEYAYDQANPTDAQLEFDATRRGKRQFMANLYDELRDKRAELIKRNPRTLGRGQT